MMNPSELVIPLFFGVFLISVFIAFKLSRAFWKFLGLTVMLFPALVIVLFLFIYVYSDLNKAYWDRRVRNLCAQDGGVTIYEKERMGQKDFESLRKNNFIIKEQEIDGYYIERSSQIIHYFWPSVFRRNYKLIRKRDKKS